MIKHRRFEPAEFRRCVALVAHRIESLTGSTGELGKGVVDLQATLSALSPSGRGRAGVLLEGIAMQAAAENPAMAVAARYVRALAQDLWDTASQPPRSARH